MPTFSRDTMDELAGLPFVQPWLWERNQESSFFGFASMLPSTVNYKDCVTLSKLLFFFFDKPLALENYLNSFSSKCQHAFHYGLGNEF